MMHPFEVQCCPVNDFQAVSTCPDGIEAAFRWQKPGKIELNRNKAYLHWRIDRNEAKTFRYLFSDNRDGFSWYAIVGFGDHRLGIRVGDVIDFGTSDDAGDSFRTAMKASVRALLQEGCDIVSISLPVGNTNRVALLRTLGFRRLWRYYRLIQKRSATPLWLTVKKLNPAGRQFDPCDPERWNLTKLYFDEV